MPHVSMSYSERHTGLSRAVARATCNRSKLRNALLRFVAAGAVTFLVYQILEDMNKGLPSNLGEEGAHITMGEEGAHITLGEEGAHITLGETVRPENAWEGLDMGDPQLVTLVRKRILPPAPPTKQYRLRSRKKVFFSQFGQDQLIAKMFQNKKQGFFFEAGGYTGEDLSNTLYLERNLGWSGVLVEPLFGSFKKIISKNRKAYVLHSGLSPKRTSHELQLDRTHPKNYGVVLSFDWRRNSSIETVPCVPLYSVLLALGNPVVDYLSLDVEGLEMQIVMTIPWSKVKIRVIGIEIKHVPEGKEAVKTYLEEQGFKFYRQLDIDYIFYHPDLSDGMKL